MTCPPATNQHRVWGNIDWLQPRFSGLVLCCWCMLVGYRSLVCVFLGSLLCLFSLSDSFPATISLVPLAGTKVQYSAPLLGIGWTENVCCNELNAGVCVKVRSWRPVRGQRRALRPGALLACCRSQHQSPAVLIRVRSNCLVVAVRFKPSCTIFGWQANGRSLFSTAAGMLQ